MNWGVITANALALLAIAVTFWGLRKADKRAERAEAATAEADAKAARALEAAERSAKATERVAEAMERQSIEAEQRSTTPGVAWRLEHFQSDTFLLTNAGRGTAYDVRVETDESMATSDLPDGVELGPDDAVKFFAALTLGTADDTVTVSWSAAPGSERSKWRRPLPPSR